MTSIEKNSAINWLSGILTLVCHHVYRTYDHPSYPVIPVHKVDCVAVVIMRSGTLSLMMTVI